jgi:hypothetical protein
MSGLYKGVKPSIKRCSEVRCQYLKYTANAPTKGCTIANLPPYKLKECPLKRLHGTETIQSSICLFNKE